VCNSSGFPLDSRKQTLHRCYKTSFWNKETNRSCAEPVVYSCTLYLLKRTHFFSTPWHTVLVEMVCQSGKDSFMGRGQKSCRQRAVALQNSTVSHKNLYSMAFNYSCVFKNSEIVIKCLKSSIRLQI
jgi:hypothetical protein